MGLPGCAAYCNNCTPIVSQQDVLLDHYSEFVVEGDASVHIIGYLCPDSEEDPDGGPYSLDDIMEMQQMGMLPGVADDDNDDDDDDDDDDDEYGSDEDDDEDGDHPVGMYGDDDSSDYDSEEDDSDDSDEEENAQVWVYLWLCLLMIGSTT